MQLICGAADTLSSSWCCQRGFLFVTNRSRVGWKNLTAISLAVPSPLRPSNSRIMSIRRLAARFESNIVLPMLRCDAARSPMHVPCKQDVPAVVRTRSIQPHYILKTFLIYNDRHNDDDGKKGQKQNRNDGRVYVLVDVYVPPGKPGGLG